MRLDALNTTSVTVGTTSSISSSSVGAALVATRPLQQLHSGLVHRLQTRSQVCKTGRARCGWFVITGVGLKHYTGRAAEGSGMGPVWLACWAASAAQRCRYSLRCRSTGGSSSTTHRWRPPWRSSSTAPPSCAQQAAAGVQQDGDTRKEPVQFVGAKLRAPSGAHYPQPQGNRRQCRKPWRHPTPNSQASTAARRSIVGR